MSDCPPRPCWARVRPPLTPTRSPSEGALARRALPCRVVKLGGSLLTWPELVPALRHWLAAQPPAIHILICGGGEFADAVRGAARCHDLPEAASHWLSIDAMHLTAHLLTELLPDAPPCRTFAALQESLQSTISRALIFDPREFLAAHEATLPGQALPQDWSATSDSIAARLAEVLAAEELVLLKSADPPLAASATSFHELAVAGYVDRYFPVAAAALPSVSFVNLRAWPAARPCLSSAAPTIP